jgi:hypothetical protein
VAFGLKRFFIEVAIFAYNKYVIGIQRHDRNIECIILAIILINSILMKPIVIPGRKTCVLLWLWIGAMLPAIQAQTCPPPITTTISAYTNTYYPGQQAVVNAGSSSVEIGAATYGTTAIGIGDILLIIQMQGVQINSLNGNSYGDGLGGSGYLNNAQLLAGNMEYIVATNAVPVTGGTLTLQSALVHEYRNMPFGVDGQYTYQVIHVPAYYNLIIGGTLTAPAWNGATGGVLVLSVVNALDMNGQVIDASGTGFRGGGGVYLDGSTIGSNTDFAALSPSDIVNHIGPHASKGEGIAGTPRLTNNNNYGFLADNAIEGYPNGSFGMGAPGNAGGGGTDYWPQFNNDNSGGGGGGNGGRGGNGGNSFSSDQPVGGYPGAAFAQYGPSRVVMGGGGGAGVNNNETGSFPNGFSSSGAAGGGIVIITAGRVVNTGTINVNGGAGDISAQFDGAGGGGAGGSVLISAASGLANVTVHADGGAAGSNNGDYFGTHYAHGPGGGGGGGVVFSSSALHAASTSNGGSAGYTIDYFITGPGYTTNFNAGAGSAGVIQTMPPAMAPPLTCFILPLQYQSVSAKNNNGQVLINWQVANEKDVEQYVIERSRNGVDFYQVGKCAYKSTGSGHINKYDFTDVSPYKDGTMFYRIKSLDINKRFVFSNMIVVKTTAVTAILSVSPSPASKSAAIQWESASNSNIIIYLLDVAGHVVMNRQYQVKKGTNILSVANLETLPNGLYFIQGYDGVNYRNGKLLIRH